MYRLMILHVAKLFVDRLPKTCYNFAYLCEGVKLEHNRVLSYRGSTFHKIVPFFVAQGGNIASPEGTGNVSVYGGQPFEAETTAQPVSHDAAGILSMAKMAGNRVGSQFFVTLAPVDWLDGEHVAFGKLVEGVHVLNMITYCGTTQGKPKQIVSINNCGILD